jgi:phospholipid/cholesterol/gamma-HCH transport system substrate-binding protein
VITPHGSRRSNFLKEKDANIMQRNIAETAMGAVVLLVAGAFMFFFYRTTDIAPTTGYELTANFSKIDGLENGSPVRIGGVKVGQVTGFELDRENFQAIVRMNIESDIQLPADTGAVITSSGLLDGKFMTLEPGADEETLKPGDRIEYTQSTPSLEQMLGQVIFSLTNDKDDKKTDQN